jgi:hypothetical protein
VEGTSTYMDMRERTRFFSRIRREEEGFRVTQVVYRDDLVLLGHFRP